MPLWIKDGNIRVRLSLQSTVCAHQFHLRKWQEQVSCPTAACRNPYHRYRPIALSVTKPRQGTLSHKYFNPLCSLSKEVNWRQNFTNLKETGIDIKRLLKRKGPSHIKTPIVLTTVQ